MNETLETHVFNDHSVKKHLEFRRHFKNFLFLFWYFFERIQFKILLLTFKSLNGLTPVYIDEMIQRYVPNRKLRSSSAFLLKQNKWNLKSYGFRPFTVAAPFLWNSLPLEIKSSPSLNIFKSKLKTHLFKFAFNLN